MYYLHKFELCDPTNLFKKFTVDNLLNASNNTSSILYAGTNTGEILLCKDASNTYHKFNKQITFLIRVANSDYFEEIFVMLFHKKFRIISNQINSHDDVNIIVGPIIQLLLNCKIPLRDEFKN